MNTPDTETCLKCGALCCKTVAVPIVTAEMREWAIARGATVTKDGRLAFFPSRCAKLDNDNLCQAQDCKPGVCTQYPVGGYFCQVTRDAIKA